MRLDQVITFSAIHHTEQMARIKIQTLVEEKYKVAMKSPNNQIIFSNWLFAGNISKQTYTPFIHFLSRVYNP